MKQAKFSRILARNGEGIMNDFLYLSLSTANKIETREPIFSHIQENIFSIFIKIKFLYCEKKNP